jgi:hypothetical protein
MRLNILHTVELDSWIKDHHYLHSTPAGAVIRLEFLTDTGERIGGMMWGQKSIPEAESAKPVVPHKNVFRR